MHSDTPGGTFIVYKKFEETQLKDEKGDKRIKIRCMTNSLVLEFDSSAIAKEEISYMQVSQKQKI